MVGGVVTAVERVGADVADTAAVEMVAEAVAGTVAAWVVAHEATEDAADWEAWLARADGSGVGVA